MNGNCISGNQSETSKIEFSCQIGHSWNASRNALAESGLEELVVRVTDSSGGWFHGATDACRRGWTGFLLQEPHRRRDAIYN